MARSSAWAAGVVVAFAPVVGFGEDFAGVGVVDHGADGDFVHRGGVAGELKGPEHGGEVDWRGLGGCEWSVGMGGLPGEPAAHGLVPPWGLFGASSSGSLSGSRREAPRGMRRRRTAPSSKST
jgi:hypothetical protein